MCFAIASGLCYNKTIHTEKGESPHAQYHRDHFGALGNEDAFFGFQPTAQLVLRQAGVGVQLRRVKIRDLDDIGHGGMHPFILLTGSCWLH